MKIAIVGFDTDGRAAYNYLVKQVDHTGQLHQLTICDKKSDLPIPEDADAVLGSEYLNNLNRFDMIIRTSGMQPRIITDSNPEPEVAAKITTQINEFLRLSPTRNIIGVTGTKGKGTTSTMIAQMLAASSKSVKLGGNIGIPPLSFIDELTADSWVVLELSSFQLTDLRYSPHIAVCLMVVPEHLDWHDDFEDYITAKRQLFAHQAASDLAIYYHDNQSSKLIAAAGQAQKIAFYYPPGAQVIADSSSNTGTIVIDGQHICRTDELQLLGRHNWQNACAAVTAVWYALQMDGVGSPALAERQLATVAAIRQVLTSFHGLEHRLELVRQLDGISYYDDSFGTTPETAIVAMQAFGQPKILILGGSDKGADYNQLAQAVLDNTVRRVLLIGNQAGRIQSQLVAVGYHDYQAGGDSMAQIVSNAKAAAQPGDVILLSPGCASFDMFANYKDRGDQFKQAVVAL